MPDPGCPFGAFVEQLPDPVAPRGSLTCRAATWAIEQLRHEHTCIAGVTSLGVDVHIWHHTDTRPRGPRELTGMADLTCHRGKDGTWRVRVQQATTGYRGRKGDPLFGIQTILRAGVENLSDKQL